jgi:phospholipid/cholesterol/gamma-HCH transport system permease protein
MSAAPATNSARVSAEAAGEVLEVALAGRWHITETRPGWTAVLAGRSPRWVRVSVDQVEKWDSSLLLFLFEMQQWCRMAGAHCDTEALPEKLTALLAQLSRSHETSVPFDRTENFITAVGRATMEVWQKGSDISHFVGECTLSLVKLAQQPHKFRWRDCLHEMQQCGAMALPIVSLISFLVGLTLAYTGALVLRQYGGDIYVADLVGLSMVREMGALMTAIVLAGRTGAAFSAHLGNMKANEEIDALESLGISPVDFLVAPRLLALGLMMPLLSLYANCLGIAGGMTVAAMVLEISPTAY